MRAYWILAILWILRWKGIVLWKAASNDQKAWYLTMPILQTLGILEIFYILFCQRNRNGG